MEPCWKHTSLRPPWCQASALLDNLGRSLRTVRESANELANAGAVMAEKGDRLADVASAVDGGMGLT